MISNRFTAIGVLTLLSSAAAHAGSAPKELYGKSISVGWTESLTGRFGSEQLTRNIGRSCQMSIYISTAGRPFVRIRQNQFGGMGLQIKTGGAVEMNRTSETAPDVSSSSATEHVNFEGRSIIVNTQFESGARRIAIDFDHNAGCKADVVNGKEAGKKLEGGVQRGRFEASSIQVGSVSCSIREGNVFGQ
jgi:hypothetical protein